MQKNKESASYILIVSLTLSLFCAILVSVAAVKLKPLQDKNAAKEKMVNILKAADVYDENKDINKLFDDNIVAKVIDLKTGTIDETIDAKTFNEKKETKNPATSIALDKKKDLAGIKRLANKAVVYLKKTGDKTDKIILPIRGYGLWGTMYGFLAMDSDGKTIKGITFYDHKETPGLGGEIVNPNWQKSFLNKVVYSKDNIPVIDLVKNINTNAEIASHQADSLAGATLTSNGVENTINFWLSKDGYKPFLNNFNK